MSESAAAGPVPPKAIELTSTSVAASTSVAGADVGDLKREVEVVVGNPTDNTKSTKYYDEIDVHVHTLARNLFPNNDSVQWPLPFKIKLTDTPATICARFKKEYGYALDTLMFEPETWENGDDPDEPKLVTRSGCSSFCFGRHKQEFVLRQKDWTIEVRV